MAWRVLLFFSVVFSGLLKTAAAPAAPKTIRLDSEALADNAELPFVVRNGGGFDKALAMNVHYAPVAAVHLQIEAALGIKLASFGGWNPQGEAHITIITPPEYKDTLGAYLSMDQLAALANAYDIQKAPVKVLGLGSGKLTIAGKSEETFFLIVAVPELMELRRAIHREFIAAGGDASAWDPDIYYPHITVGFTKRDLHLSDGVIKDLKHSADKRFVVL